jgi:hypothetical protein
MGNDYSHDWEMDARSHRFPVASDTTTYTKILQIVKVYDETCMEARAQMIRQINKLLDKEELKK